MKRIQRFLKAHPAAFYLIIFLLLMGSALLLYPAAEAGSLAGMGVFLGLIIVGNLLVLFN